MADQIPETRIAQAAKVVIASGGKVAPVTAFKAVGLPKPQRNRGLYKSNKAFTNVIDKYLPDDKLLKRHAELLDAKTVRRTYIKGDLTEEVEEMDSNAVGKALDMGYKIKGMYAPERHQVAVFDQYNDLSEDDLMRIATGDVIDGETLDDILLEGGSLGEEGAYSDNGAGDGGKSDEAGEPAPSGKIT